MSQWQLSTGVCAWLNEASPDEINELADSSVYSLQVLSIVLVTSNVDKYRIILSDGIHFVQAMLVMQLNESVSRGEIPQYAIVTVNKLKCHIVDGIRLIMIHDLHVFSREQSKIGSPRPAPIHETPITPMSERTDVSMEIAPEASSSTWVKPGPETSQPVPIQKPGKPTIPIEGINHYKTNFTIKARVAHKSDIRPYSSARAEGKLFSVTFVDGSGQISATGFNAVVDELYDKFEEGKVYYVSKVRVATTKYCKGHKYELHFERNTEVEECLDAIDSPVIKYTFTPLSSLHNLQKDSTCDVIGIVTEVGPLSEIIAKATNRQVVKRDLTIVDSSLHSVRLTIWGKEAETFIGDDFPVIAFKGVKVSDFGGRSLSLVSSSYMSISPDISEAHFLRGWYDNIGVQKSFQSSGGSSFGAFNRSEMRHISDIVDSVSQLGSSDKIDVSVCASVMKILDEKLIYPSCPMQGCSKKVTQIIGSNEWRCEKCQKTFPRPEHRYRITMAVADWSGQTWFTGFDPVGLAVLGKTAEELEELKQRNDREYKAFVAQASRKTYNFRCLAKQDTYNDRTSVKYDVTKICPLDYYEEAKHLRDLLMQPHMTL